MALPSSGIITMGDINVELGRTRTTSNTSLQVLANLAKTNSTPYVNSSVPRISHWYGYVHIVADTTPPPAPSISLSLYGESYIDISWSPVSDTSGILTYMLYIGTTSNPNLFDEVPFDINSYSFYGLNPSTTYYIRIKAVDNANNESAYSNTIIRRTGAACFVEGTIITLGDGTTTRIEDLFFGQDIMSSTINGFDDTEDIELLHQWGSLELIENRIVAQVGSNKPSVVPETIIINNGLLEATPEHNHLILRSGSWCFIEFQNIEVGDAMYNNDGEVIIIDSLEINTEPKTVYKLDIVGNANLFYANGLLTHNVKQPI